MTARPVTRVATCIIPKRRTLCTNLPDAIWKPYPIQQCWVVWFQFTQFRKWLLLKVLKLISFLNRCSLSQKVVVLKLISFFKQYSLSPFSRKSKLNYNCSVTKLELHLLNWLYWNEYFNSHILEPVLHKIIISRVIIGYFLVNQDPKQRTNERPVNGCTRQRTGSLKQPDCPSWSRTSGHPARNPLIHELTKMNPLGQSRESLVETQWSDEITLTDDSNDAELNVLYYNQWVYDMWSVVLYYQQLTQVTVWCVQYSDNFKL